MEPGLAPQPPQSIPLPPAPRGAGVPHPGAGPRAGLGRANGSLATALAVLVVLCVGYIAGRYLPLVVADVRAGVLWGRP